MLKLWAFLEYLYKKFNENIYYGKNTVIQKWK